MSYQFLAKIPPEIRDPEVLKLLSWAQQQFDDLTRAIGQTDLLYLKARNVAPAKPREGMIVLADGTNWNPGAGQGVYCYYGAAWNKLG